jgi:hypothetical protein
MRKIHQIDKVNENNLWTRTIINKKVESDRYSCLIPRWFSWCYLLTLLCLFTILIAANAILLNGKSPANYQESCADRSCNKALNMKCIAKVCTCIENQFFLTKCIDKKSFNESCLSNGQCKKNLKCIKGKCQCDDNNFLYLGRCIPRKSYQEPCQADNCLTTAMLKCDATTTKCVCPPDR